MYCWWWIPWKTDYDELGFEQTTTQKNLGWTTNLNSIAQPDGLFQNKWDPVKLPMTFSNKETNTL